MSDPATEAGILNDWDLAAVVNIGQYEVTQSDFRRTGTLPFMAVDLLSQEGFNGEIARRYRHDLESFSWCLSWIAGCVKDKKEKAVYPFTKWLRPSFLDVQVAKLAFSFTIYETPFKPSFDHYTTLLRVVVRHWFEVQRDILAGMVEANDFAHIDHVIRYVQSDEKVDEGGEISSKFHKFFSFLKGGLEQDGQVITIVTLMDTSVMNATST
jgi:hypothetical protein